MLLNHFRKPSEKVRGGTGSPRRGRVAVHSQLSPRFRVGNRGQSLIIVILVLLAVAAMAALFVAMLISSQSRTARQADLAALKNIVEAGVRYADYQLTYSAEGADWRPLASSLTNPYPYEFGDGRFRLTLSYNPQANDPLSRFIKIECVASLRGNPFLKRSMVAYKPVLLADYLRFVTNRDHSSLPAVLGVPEVVQGAGTQGYETVLGVTPGRGTAAFTNGDPRVAGTNTQWLLEVRPGDLVRYDADGFWYIVATVDSNIQLTLTSNFGGTAGGGAYSIGRCPVRINSDVNWAGPVTAVRGPNEPMEVVGARSGWTPWHPTLNAYTTGSATFTITSPTVSGSGTSWVTDGVLPGDWIRYDDADNVWYLIQTVVDDTTITLAENYAQTGGGPGNYTIRAGRNMYAANTRYQDPPAMNTSDPTTGQSRYLLLTRDSGAWLQDAALNWYNTGWYGYGEGVYVDNFGDIQHAHNLTQLRNEWMNPTPGANGWDTMGWSYTPWGVQVILYAGSALQSDIYGYTYPVIELIADNRPGSPSLRDRNASGASEYWLNADLTDHGTTLTPSGVTLPNNVLIISYPPNGVIYAEGNVRVAGTLPPATATGLVQYFNDNGTPADASDDQRYYDLTVVSGGTVYIEGDLLSPNTYRTNAGAGLVAADQDSRLALLARDYVCLNTTALGARVDVAGSTGAVWTPPGGGVPGYWSITPGGSLISFNFRNFQPGTVAANSLLYLWHSGVAIVPANTNEAADVQMADPTPTLFDWGGGQTTFSFVETLGAPVSLWQSDRFSLLPAPLDWEVSVRPFLIIAPAGNGATSNYNLQVTGGSGAGYRLAGLQILPPIVNIDALIYAQEGSWFVLPGPWFNNNWNNLGNYISNDPVHDTSSSGVPSYRMALGSIPLDDGSGNAVPYQPPIIINGAISENHTAALGDAHDWLSKWSGPDNAAIGQTPLLSYQFDAGLRATVYGDTDGNSLPRLPKLPCPPGVIVWEEQ